MEPRRGENQNQETSLTKSCEAVSETVMAKAVGPALSQTFLRPGPTRPKIDKAKVRGFPSGPGAVFKEQTPHFREAEYMAATGSSHTRSFRLKLCSRKLSTYRHSALDVSNPARPAASLLIDAWHRTNRSAKALFGGALFSYVRV